jgi:hypothetical protein
MSTCDCVAKLDAAVKKKFGSDAYIETKLSMNMKTGATKASFPPLYFAYFEGKKKKRSFFPFNFCPVCGKAHK